MATPLREALRTFRRTPLLSALSIASIGFSLFTIGLFVLAALNFRHALQTVAERVEVVAFILRGTPSESIITASKDIEAFPEVQEVAYVSAEEALARARAELVEFREAFRDLETNPLPPSLEIRLKPDYRNTVSAQAVAERVRGFPFVDDVRYGRDWVQRLDRLRTLAGLVGIVIGLAFAGVGIAIIGVTIRITILQRATEISIMRLVGATNRYIRSPFLLEGFIKGLTGGILAVALCWLVLAIFRKTSADLGQSLVFFGGLEIALMLVFGAALGLLGTLLSVGRQLRNV